MKIHLLGLFISLIISGSFTQNSAFGEAIKEIKVAGNARVETIAITSLLSSKVGEELDATLIREDIKALYELGFFSDIRIFKKTTPVGLAVVIRVKEKPAISKIEFEGLSELSEDDLKDSLETQLYTIVDEGALSADLRMIEKKYNEKGYYLAKATYELKDLGRNEAAVTFHVDESGKVLVSEVNILGNNYFSDTELLEKMASRPYTRWSATLGAPSIYQDDFVARDLEFLAFYYKDAGFADIKVGKPHVSLSVDKKYAWITFELEEGVQFTVADIKFSGDVGKDYYTLEELEAETLLKKDDIFRFTRFSKDIEKLVDRYGDLGYAYVDINPGVDFDRKNKKVSINYRITKGPKVYFGEMNIVGNTKTRDNVIRRELAVRDTELYSGTRLAESRNNISRLGYFESVQVTKERDPDTPNVLNLKIKVSEKPTGQLQAAVGYSPQDQNDKPSVFAQGRYDEKNQSGKGWNSNLTFKWNGEENYKLDAGFFDPRVDDSQWSFGLNVAFESHEVRYPTGQLLPQTDKSVSASVGRSLIELVRANISLRHSRIELSKRPEDLYFSDNPAGIKNSLVLGLSRKDLNNYLDPNEGTQMNLRHKIVGGPLQGSSQYMETSFSSDAYIPIDFSDSYRTYIKFHTSIAKLWSLGREKIPTIDRYRLGGDFDLRGFAYNILGPSEKRVLGPQGGYIDFNVGGDKQLYFQLEYFVPLIPDAGIKALFFADAGAVFREEEEYSLNNLNRDVGFGFRWITPIAPFRFEWAYPWDEQREAFGDMRFIFSVGF